MGVSWHHIPGRLAAGAFILNSGLSKRHVDESTAATLHGAAAGTYPFLRSVPPQRFVRLLSAGEITLGTALLLPLVPAKLAGAGLAGFSAALLGIYLRTPGMHEPGSVRPTQQGNAIAKDVWMLGIGLGMAIDAFTRDQPRTGRRP